MVSGINIKVIDQGDKLPKNIMNKVRTAVISDLGKVLIHFDNTIFFKKLADFSPYSALEISTWAGKQRKLFEDFDCGRIDPEGFFQAFQKQLRISLPPENFFSIYSDIFSLNHRPVAVMKRLLPDTPLVMLSNTDPVRFGFIRSHFPEVMFFHKYVLSYEEGCMKPDPRIYHRAARLSGLPEEACVFIDDRLENIKAAEKIGMKTILFGSDTELYAQLQQQGLRFRSEDLS